MAVPASARRIQYDDCVDAGGEPPDGEDPPDEMKERLRAKVLGLELDDEPAAASSQPARKLLGGRYELGTELGSGTMGVVHRARDMHTGKDVAIKILRRFAAGKGQAVARFRREAQLAASLEHGNIVRILDHAELEDGRSYIATELVTGKSLRAVLAADKQVCWKKATALLVQIAKALEYAHDKGVVHRDLKPANIMLTAGEHAAEVKVIDFGLARCTDERGLTKLTDTGDLIGTPMYMSPEQAKGECAGPSSDVYALGCIAYEMLTGRRPIEGATFAAVMMQRQQQEPRPFAEVAPDHTAPAELEGVVLRALRRAPEKRPSMAAFRLELERAGRPSSSLAGRALELCLRAFRGPSTRPS
jgi:eukaryotic-like serine/threonine-protein kinase